ncbi:MAG TPA: hypothetical protein VK563_00440 [Puia sp.]|nr:hypothetical protein [Puia sp.]
MKTKKILLAATLIIAGSMIATTGYSQVYVNAHVGFGIRAPRVVIAARPAPVLYQDAYAPAPAPVYQDEYGAPAPVYQDGYADPVVYETAFPGYAYYNYPAWNGHYRDRFYFAHYRPFFEREHSNYFRNGRFEHQRFEHEHLNHERGGRGRDHRR